MFLVVAAACHVAPGYTFHRSFRNGYPAEWNVGKDQATESFSIKSGSVKFTDGKGTVIRHSTSHEIVGVVTRVVDNDTIWVTDAQRRRYTIRIVDIVTPGTSQPFGGEFAARTNALAEGKRVRVTYSARDRYGRILGTVWLADVKKKPVAT